MSLIYYALDIESYPKDGKFTAIAGTGIVCHDPNIIGRYPAKFLYFAIQSNDAAGTEIYTCCIREHGDHAMTFSDIYKDNSIMVALFFDSWKNRKIVYEDTDHVDVEEDQGNYDLD